MSAQTQSINTTSVNSTVSKDSQGSSQTQNPITIGQLMALLSQTQLNFGRLQEVLAISNSEEVIDPKTGAVTWESFSQIGGDQLIEAAKEATQKVINEIAAQQRASHRHGLFGKIAAALSIVVAVTVVIGTGGAASALLPLAITAVIS